MMFLRGDYRGALSTLERVRALAQQTGVVGIEGEVGAGRGGGALRVWCGWGGVSRMRWVQGEVQGVHCTAFCVMH